MTAAAITRPRLSRPGFMIILTVLAGAALATQLQTLPGEPAVYVVAGPAAAVAIFAATRGPQWCVVAFLALALSGAYRHSVAVGPVDIRPTDLAFVALALWVLLLRQRGEEGKGDVGQRTIGLFLAVLAITLFPVAARGQAGLAELAVSWARLAVTFALIWLLPYALRTPARRLFAFRGFLLIAAVQVSIALLVTVPSKGWEPRARWGVSPNQIGLLAGVLIVAALHAPVPRLRSFRLACLSIGVLGLIGTRSIGALAATGLTLGMFGFVPPRLHPDGPRPTPFTPIRMAALAIGVISLVGVLRPLDLPGSTQFGYSSTAQRIVKANGGLELYRRHPVLGIGWQRNSLPETIGSPEIAETLRRRFPNVDPEFYPDVNAGSVHNAYIQMLAEAGTVGLAVLLALFVVVRRRTRSLIGSLGDGPDARLAWTARLVLFLCLIWWNDNPLFGSEPETVIAVTMLGLLASFRAVDAAVPEDLRHPLPPREAAVVRPRA